MNTWHLIAPAEDWRNPLPIEEDQIPLLMEIAQRLELRHQKDTVQKKFYLGLPGTPKIKLQRPKSGSVVYPSGSSFSKARLSEAQIKGMGYVTTGNYTAAPLLEIPRNAQLSENFAAHEFFPKDDSYRFLRLDPRLLEHLESIRQKLGGVPITIHSAYRPLQYNAEVGGVSNSTHIDGLAIDLSAAGVSTAKLHQVAEDVIGQQGGVGFYPSQGFVHIDVRGYASRWIG